MAELNMVAPMAILNIATCLESALEYFKQAAEDGRDTKPCREAVRKIHTEFLTACRKPPVHPRKVGDPPEGRECSLVAA
ncbi:hypothetical protein OV450_6912 [Actinobacteria bacterium OV450]|nr:hypothetical protein OV450_6912 [Actinobacteria bacterium OV450]